MHGPDFQKTKLTDEIDLAFSWTGGTSPTLDFPGDSAATPSTISYAATGKFTIVLNGARPMKAFGTPKWFINIQPAAGGVVDANMKAIAQSYDPTTGTLVIWTYGPTGSGDSTPILTAPGAGTKFHINFRGSMHA